MKLARTHLDRAALAAALLLGVASVALHDADKAPLYFLVAYAIGRPLSGSAP
jgi:hypothetical protein